MSKNAQKENIKTQETSEEVAQSITEEQKAQSEDKTEQPTDTQADTTDENIDLESEQETEVEPEISQEDDVEIKDEAEDELAKANEELQNMKDKYLRLYAEFENYQRRTAKEKVSTVALANERLIEALLPVLDDFERSAQFEKEPPKDGTSEKGILLIYQKLKSILEKEGLKVMESSVGKEFDPELQSAFAQIPAPDESQKGKVIEEVEKGYLLNDKIIRYAKVVVGQ